VQRSHQKARVGCDQYHITRNYHFDFSNHSFPRTALANVVERSSLRARYKLGLVRSGNIVLLLDTGETPGELKAWGAVYEEVLGCLSLQSHVVLL
jgi:hypothetical protein